MEEQAQRFVEVSLMIHKLEAKNINKIMQQKKEQLKDVSQTVTQLEEAYKKATEAVAKEKKDVDDLHKPSVRELFKDTKSFEDKMSKEMEEYLEAVSEQEMIKKQLDGVTEQKKKLEVEHAEQGELAESLLKLYDEQDDILGKIFNGAYGSELENKLEAEYDTLHERKERIHVAKYKWSNARILLQHAVKQLGVAGATWMALKDIASTNVQAKYTMATEVRNNLVAAGQNIRSANKYLNNITFPYCEEKEMTTLDRATANCYVDMQSPDRHQHAYNCFHVTYRRATALLQWFDNVINNTIAKDFEAAKKALAPVEKQLREERLRLIKEKVGKDAADLSLTKPEFDDDEEDAELMNICQAEQAEDEGGNLLSVNTTNIKAATPLPLSELAPPPSQDDLFGNIEQLKQQHEKEMAEFDKAQETNKARMEQGLQEKLAMRRNRKARMPTD